MAMSVQNLSSMVILHNSDAAFRSWGQTIANAIVAAGLVKTTDTGQIDWGTVTKPIANTAGGYEIYRFDDALQATRPIFIKFEFGTGGSVNNPQMWVTAGTATDGAGNITSHASFPNTILSRRTLLYTSTTAWPPGTTVPFWIASDEKASLLLAGWYNFPGQSTLGFTTALLERTRNFDTSFNGEGLFSLISNPSQTFIQALIIENSPWITTQPTSTGYVLGTMTSLDPFTGFFNGVQNFWPIFTGQTPKFNGPTKHLVYLPNSTDLPIHSQFNLTHLGETKRWIVGRSQFCVRIEA